MRTWRMVSLVELGLDADHELGLLGDVEAVGARGLAGRRDGMAVQAEGARAGEHGLGAGSESREGSWVGSVHDKDGHVVEDGHIIRRRVSRVVVRKNTSFGQKHIPTCDFNGSTLLPSPSALTDGSSMRSTVDLI